MWFNSESRSFRGYYVSLGAPSETTAAPKFWRKRSVWVARAPQLGGTPACADARRNVAVHRQAFHNDAHSWRAHGGAESNPSGHSMRHLAPRRKISTRVICTTNLADAGVDPIMDETAYTARVPKPSSKWTSLSPTSTTKASRGAEPLEGTSGNLRVRDKNTTAKPDHKLVALVSPGAPIPLFQGTCCGASSTDARPCTGVLRFNF